MGKGRVMQSGRGGGFSLFVLILCAPLSLPGCAAGIVGAILGIQSLTKNDGNDSEPLRVLNLGVLEGTPGSGRADDLSRVRISFEIVGGSGGAVTAQVGYSTDGTAFPRATILEGTPELNLPASSSKQVVTWNARADGIDGFRRVDLQVMPMDSNGEGVPATVHDVAIGNTPPEARGVE